jgi:hypothetical protein
MVVVQSISTIESYRYFTMSTLSQSFRLDCYYSRETYCCLDHWEGVDGLDWDRQVLLAEDDVP